MQNSLIGGIHSVAGLPLEHEDNSVEGHVVVLGFLRLCLSSIAPAVIS